jgi:hypothetical protein
MTAPTSPPTTAAGILTALACGRPGCPCASAAQRGTGKTHCPGHDDEHPSFTVSTRDGRVLVHCWAGCAQDGVIGTLRERGLWTSRRTRSRSRHAATRETRYAYVDADGVLVATHVRFDGPAGKSFVWERPDDRRGLGGLPIANLPVYRLHELLASPADATVVFTEGEKAADALQSSGFVTVALGGGANQRNFGSALDPLRGHPVVLWSDFDEPGRRFMHAIAAALTDIAAEVRWVEPLSLVDSADNRLDPGHDAADYLRDGHDADDVQRVIAAARPIPVPSGNTAPRAPVPTFPVHLLPYAVRRLVEEGAAALDCPPNLIALPLLTFAAGCIGNRYTIRIKPGWEQRAILWTGVVAHPGSAKTPAQDLAQHPLDVLQHEAHEVHRLALKEYEQALAEWTAIKDKAERGEKPERPEEEHFYTTDSTPEAVARMLGHPGSVTPGFVVVRDELVGWVRAFDAYKAGRGGERQTWLSMWAGKAFKSDRAGRDSYFVPSPAVSVAGGIQPDALPSLQEEAGQRDGFIERFLWSYPDTRPMRWSERSVAETTKDAVTAVFRKLRYAGTDGVVLLSTSARALFATWVEENADAQEHIGGLMRGVYAKLPNQAARLALLLHVLAHPDDPVSTTVSAETMAAALELAEYVRAHAGRVMAHFGDTAAVDGPLGVRVLRSLRRAGGWVTRGQLHAELGGHIAAAALTATLKGLERAGLAECRPIPSGTAGGRPGEEWRAGAHSSRESTETTEETPTNGEVISVVSVDSQGVTDEDEGETFEL